MSAAADRTARADALRGSRRVPALALALVTACSTAARAPDRGHDALALRSNVEREDYAGSERCAACHAEIHAAWASSPMHRMTRLGGLAELRAPFDGTSFTYRDARLVAERQGDRAYLQVLAPGEPERLWRVTRVIGGRHREDYVGVAVTSTAEDARASPLEFVLPISWVYEPGEWRYKGYSVMVQERPSEAIWTAGAEWTSTCLFCHNTVPLLSTVYDDLAHDPNPSYQGSVPSNLLPSDRRQRFEITDEAALSRAIDRELAVIGAPPAEGGLEPRLSHAIASTRARFGPDHLVELGIGCEACHGGSRAHADDPRVAPSYDLISSFFRTAPAEGTSPPETGALALNRACARCHSVLFSQYPHTWEGGQRRRGAGGSHVSSGEARDYLLGGCASEMTCTTCHDPHAEDRPDRLAALATPAGNATCTGCHDALAGDDALRAHAHHDPSGAGASCVGCHMPAKNMALDYELTRYHRIGSPTDRARVERDRPIECALCHADRSVGSLLADIERFWGRRYDAARLDELYGSDRDVGVVDATLARGLPHEQAVAIAILGERRDRSALPRLADQLAHPYPLVRYFARESIAEITGERPPLDMSLPGDEIAAQGRAWLAQR